MSSGETQSNGEYEYAEPPESQPEPEPEVSGLLENVLDLTEKAASGQDDESVRPLAAVVQKQHEDTLTQEGLAELVTEALRDYALESRLSEQTWKNLSVRVASVLFDDPSARERLDRLWQQLTEIRL